jgi:hypothetical protein
MKRCIRPRLSIRALFLVIALFGSWLGLQVNWVSNRHKAITWMRTQAALWDDLPVDQQPHFGEPAPASLRLLGEVGLTSVLVVIANKTEIAAKERELKRLFPEAYISVAAPGPSYKGRNAHLVNR